MSTVSGLPGIGFAAVADLPEITASNLKNKFSEVARRSAKEPLAITRHGRRESVILSAEQYEALQQSQLGPLKMLTAELDQLIAKINTPKDRAARSRFFNASAVTAAPALVKLKRQRKNGR